MNKLQVLEYEINTKVINEEDYVSLTDIAKKVNGDEPRFVIQNWMRNKDTIDYLEDYGRKYIIQILTVWDSRRLKMKQEETDSQCLHQNG